MTARSSRRFHASLERYTDTLFTVLRPTRYLDAEEEVEFGELHTITGSDFMVTIRHRSDPISVWCADGGRPIPSCSARGPTRSSPALSTGWSNEYSPVVSGLEIDIDEIEQQLFSGDPAVSQGIYLLMGQVMDFQRAVDNHEVCADLWPNLRDVSDHVIRISTRSTVSAASCRAHSALTPPPPRSGRARRRAN